MGRSVLAPLQGPYLGVMMPPTYEKGPFTGKETTGRRYLGKVSWGSGGEEEGTQAASSTLAWSLVSLCRADSQPGRTDLPVHPSALQYHSDA